MVFKSHKYKSPSECNNQPIFMNQLASLSRSMAGFLWLWQRNKLASLSKAAKKIRLLLHVPSKSWLHQSSNPSLTMWQPTKKFPHYLLFVCCKQQKSLSLSRMQLSVIIIIIFIIFNYVSLLLLLCLLFSGSKKLNNSCAVKYGVPSSRREVCRCL